VKQNKISQRENCYISEMPEYFCTKFRSFVCHRDCTNVKLPETQTSRTNFTTEQTVDFIINVT